MANDCLPQIQACAIRVTTLETNGVPHVGPVSMYVSSALTSVALKWVTEKGDDFMERNACGDITVDYTGPEVLRHLDVTITMLTPDPELDSLLSGGSVLTSGGKVGFQAPPLGIVADEPVSIELWTKRIRDRKQDTVNPYAWWVLPYVANLRPDDMTFEDKNLPQAFVGQLYENANWYNGPTNDWPVASQAVYQWMPWGSMPTAKCGFSAVAAS